MRTIQPVTKYSSSRITELAPNDVEEILVAARNLLADVFTQFASKSSIHPAPRIERQPRGMKTCLSRRSEARMLEETRKRAAEFYFNGTCLLRAVFSRRFRKIPFFLRHLWCALAG